MKIPFLSHPAEFAVERLNLDDAAHLPAIHAEDFTRAWSEDEFESLIAQDTVFGFGVWQIGQRAQRPAGFVLARLAAGEAEILTIAVARATRRQGLGRELMEAVLRHLHAERADELFLEVAENNQPAIALYRRLGFFDVGRRPAYYGEPGEEKTAALIMRRDLR